MPTLMTCPACGATRFRAYIIDEVDCNVAEYYDDEGHLEERIRTDTIEKCSNTAYECLKCKEVFGEDVRAVHLPKITTPSFGLVATVDDEVAEKGCTDYSPDVDDDDDDEVDECDDNATNPCPLCKAKREKERRVD